MIACFDTLAFLGLGTQELVVILLILLILFGAAKIPEIARSLGKSIREFKKGASEGSEPGPDSEKDKTGKEPGDKTN
jgi:sec-independent protein translocase protein TatA